MGMKATDVLKHLDFANMSKTEKAALKKKFLAHKEHLKKSMAAMPSARAGELAASLMDGQSVTLDGVDLKRDAGGDHHRAPRQPPGHGMCRVRVP